jgi:hypothetical protein
MAATASRWIRALRTVQPSEPAINKTETRSVRTLIRSFHRQGFEIVVAMVSG